MKMVVSPPSFLLVVLAVCLVTDFANGTLISLYSLTNKPVMMLHNNQTISASQLIEPL